MSSFRKWVIKSIVSYWKCFRIIFVFFSLFLMGDAFYRWDGFKYYASFSEFLPTVALVFIIWSMLAVLATAILWMLWKAGEWSFQRIGIEVKISHILIFLISFTFLSVLIWIVKEYVWNFRTTLNLKKMLVLFLVFISIFLTWLFRYKTDHWEKVIQERITPLVLLFGMFFIFSVPLVAYTTLHKAEEKVMSQITARSPDSDNSRPNILLVTFDALTSRDMSVYGYHRPTTPFISKWAKSASIFTKVEAASNSTAPTVSSLMTGVRLWTHETYHPEGFMRYRSVKNMPYILQKNGYFNINYVANRFASPKTLRISNAFSVNVPLNSFAQTNSGFLIEIISIYLHKFFGGKIQLSNWIVEEDFIFYKFLSIISPRTSKSVRSNEAVFNKFLKNFEKGFPEPFFVWIHQMPPHHPYLPREPHMGMFDSSAELRTRKSQMELHKLRNSPKEMKPFAEIWRARYNELIRHCDKEFENFITRLEAKNISENLVIILSSDHGESFEHDYFTHGGQHLYEQVTNIPLIIKEPGQNKGKIINALVEQIDITATILDLADISVPMWMEGRSLVPLMRGKTLPQRPVYAMTLEANRSRGHQITSGTIAVWEGDYKLIHYLAREKNNSLLFNLKEDPDEINNLFNKDHKIGQRLLTLIQNNLKTVNERIRVR